MQNEIRAGGRGRGAEDGGNLITARYWRLWVFRAEPAFLDERRAPRRQHAGLQARTETIATCQQTVAGGRANGVRGVGVREAEALAGQAIEVRCGNLRLESSWLLALNVAFIRVP
jgi:hypothetical protein